MAESDAKDALNDGRSDFDFFIGTWKVHHRRLRERLKGSTSWEEFGGRAVAQKVLGGLGNFDEITMERESGLARGMTLRIFNPNTQQWSIHWADSISTTLLQPMVGEFKDGRGLFFDHETFEGKGIFSRFIWTETTHMSCRWEQAFSADGGATWETNWIMDFTHEG
jgi:hypothetical protein